MRWEFSRLSWELDWGIRLISKPVWLALFPHQMGQKPGYISVYRRKLIDDQIIMASYGYVQFMLPFFDRFVEEQIMFDEF